MRIAWFFAFASPVLAAGAFAAARVQCARELGVLRAELASVSARLEKHRAACDAGRGSRVAALHALASETTLHREHAGVPGTPDEPSRNAAYDSEPVEAGPAQEVPSDAETLFVLEQAFLAEPTERGFQHQAESQLGEKLTRLAEPEGRAHVECRSSLCRANVALPDEKSYEAFVARTATARGFWDGETTLRVQSRSNGRVELALYFAKNGASLPVSAE